ncbi:hypothetical protein ACUXK4_004526 [Methylorubrum extorquens]
MAYRFARDFEVFVSEANFNLSREAGYSTPGEAVVTAADIVVKAAGPNDTLLDTYVEAAAASAEKALTEAQVATVGVALSRDDGDGFAVFARQGEFKDRVAHWPADATLAATLKAALSKKGLIAR